MSESGNALLELRSNTVMMNVAPNFLRNSLQLWIHTPTVPLFEQFCCNGVTLPETLERIRPCQVAMEQAQMMTRCMSRLSRKARGRAKANTKIEKEIARTTQATRALQTPTRGRTVAELDIRRKTAGDQVEAPATIPPGTTATRRKARTTRKAKGKANTWTLWKRISLLKQPSTVSYPSQTPRTIGELLCNSNVEPWIKGVTINSVSSWCRVFAS